MHHQNLLFASCLTASIDFTVKDFVKHKFVFKMIGLMCVDLSDKQHSNADFDKYQPIISLDCCCCVE